MMYFSFRLFGILGRLVMQNHKQYNAATVNNESCNIIHVMKDFCEQNTSWEMKNPSFIPKQDGPNRSIKDKQILLVIFLSC